MEGQEQQPAVTEPAEDQSVAEIMAQMKAEFLAEIAKKDAEIKAMEVKHAKEIRDLLTGADTRIADAQDEETAIDTIAETIAKNLGGKFIK